MMFGGKPTLSQALLGADGPAAALDEEDIA